MVVACVVLVLLCLGVFVLAFILWLFMQVSCGGVCVDMLVIVCVLLGCFVAGGYVVLLCFVIMSVGAPVGFAFV